MRALSPDPLDTPLLAMLSEQGVRQAESTKIEWLIEVWQDGDTILKADFNYMQIQRNPFSPNNPGRKEDGTLKTPEDYLREHWRGIEACLWYGRREFYPGPNPLGMCGGVMEWLGRAPGKYDTLSLRILRPTTYQYYESFVDPKADEAEFVTEFSLQVVDGGSDGDNVIVEPPAWLLEAVGV